MNSLGAEVKDDETEIDDKYWPPVFLDVDHAQEEHSGLGLQAENIDLFGDILNLQPRCDAADYQTSTSPRGHEAGTITLSKWFDEATPELQWLTKTTGEFPLPLNADALEYIVRIQEICDETYTGSLKIDLYDKLLVSFDVKDVSKRSLSDGVQDLVKVLSSSTFPDLSLHRHQILTCLFHDDSQSVSWFMLLMSLHLHRCFTIGFSHDRIVWLRRLEELPRKVAYNLIFAQLWLKNCKMVKLALYGIDHSHIRTLKDFARGIVWPRVDKIDSLPDTLDDIKRSFDLSQAMWLHTWVRGLIMPGPISSFVLLGSLIDVTFSGSMAKHLSNELNKSFIALERNATNIGIIFHESSFWHASCIVGKVLGPHPEVWQVIDWICGIPTPRYLWKHNVVRVFQKPTRHYMESFYIDALPQESSPVGYQQPFYDVQEFHIPIISFDAEQYIEFLSLGFTSCHDEDDPTLHYSYISFLVDEKEHRRPLRFNVLFIEAYKCKNGPHVLHSKFHYAKVKARELLEIDAWNHADVDEEFSPLSNDFSFSATEVPPDRILVVEALRPDEEIFARAWCSNLGLSAVVGNVSENNCAACAIRQAYIAHISVVILTHEKPARAEQDKASNWSEATLIDEDQCTEPNVDNRDLFAELKASESRGVPKDTHFYELHNKYNGHSEPYPEALSMLGIEKSTDCESNLSLLPGQEYWSQNVEDSIVRGTEFTMPAAASKPRITTCNQPESTKRGRTYSNAVESARGQHPTLVNSSDYLAVSQQPQSDTTSDNSSQRSSNQAIEDMSLATLSFKPNGDISFGSTSLQDNITIKADDFVGSGNKEITISFGSRASSTSTGSQKIEDSNTFKLGDITVNVVKAGTFPTSTSSAPSRYQSTVEDCAENSPELIDSPRRVVDIEDQIHLSPPEILRGGRAETIRSTSIEPRSGFSLPVLQEAPTSRPGINHDNPARMSLSSPCQWNSNLENDNSSYIVRPASTQVAQKHSRTARQSSDYSVQHIRSVSGGFTYGSGPIYDDYKGNQPRVGHEFRERRRNKELEYPSDAEIYINRDNTHLSRDSLHLMGGRRSSSTSTASSVSSDERSRSNSLEGSSSYLRSISSTDERHDRGHRSHHESNNKHQAEAKKTLRPDTKRTSVVFSESQPQNRPAREISQHQNHHHRHHNHDHYRQSRPHTSRNLAHRDTNERDHQYTRQQRRSRRVYETSPRREEEEKEPYKHIDAWKALLPRRGKGERMRVKALPAAGKNWFVDLLGAGGGGRRESIVESRADRAERLARGVKERKRRAEW